MQIEDHGSQVDDDLTLTWAARLAGSTIALIGLVVMAAWAFGWELPKRLGSGLATMKFNTALCLLMLGAALVTGTQSGFNRATRFVVAAIALVTLVQDASGRSLGIDQLLFDDPRGGTAHPGRMAVTTACCLLAGALGMAALTAGRRRLATASALTIVVAGWLGCLGYLFGVEALYRVGPFSSMAGHTALAMVALGVGILASVPNGLLPWVVRASDPGAVLLRRIVPLALLGLPVLAAIRLAGQHAGWYGTEFGLAIMVVISSVSIAGVAVHCARVVNRAHRAQLDANQALSRLNSELERIVSERTAALAASEAWARALAGSAPVGIFRTTAAGGCTYVNDRWCEIYGIRVDQALGDGWAAGVHPDDRDSVFGEWTAATHKGAVFDREFRVVRPSGETSWVHARGVQVDDSGAVGYVGTVEDITVRRAADEERSRRESALRKAEQEFRLSFEDAPIGKALVALDGKWIRVNRALCAIVGYSSDELMTKTFQDITLPDDLDTDLAFVKQMLTGEIASYSMEKRYLHADGHIVWINLSVSLVLDEDGRPVHFISQIENISDRKTQELALERSHALLEGSQALASVGSWEWDTSAGPGQGAIWSREMYRIHGVDPATFAMSTEAVDALIHPDDHDTWVGHLMKAVTSGEDMAGFAYRAVHPDGATRWVWSQAGYDPNRPGVLVGFVQDITDRRALEDELERLAIVDELTGLRNRRGFLAAADPLSRLAQREGQNLVLIYIDLDNMKAINDRYGHRAGDQALVETAQLLRRTFRKSDVIARLGGDEFCVLVADDDLEAKACIDRLRERAEPTLSSPNLSLSIGTAHYNGFAPIPIETLLDRADSSMYEDKLRKRRPPRSLAAP